jgi:molybdopterin synthase sulfur carrier subunit
MILRFSGLLLRLVDYERMLDVKAPTLGAAVQAAEDRFPRLRQVLRDGQGELRGIHRIFINGELSPSACLSTPLKDSDDVEFLTAIAGG